MTTILTTVKLPQTLHYLVGVAAASRRQSAHAWMLHALDESIQRQAKSDAVLATALKGKVTPPKATQQQQEPA